MSTKWLPDAGGAKGKDWKWMDFMGEKSLDLFSGETGFSDNLILKLLSETPGFMEDSMDIIMTDQHGASCMIGS